MKCYHSNEIIDEGKCIKCGSHVNDGGCSLPFCEECIELLTCHDCGVWLEGYEQDVCYNCESRYLEEHPDLL